MSALAEHPVAQAVRIVRADGASFGDWAGLLDLILAAFAGMHGRIDPPSSALRLTPDLLKARADNETMLLAYDGSRLAGCAFLAGRGDRLYLGKLAVAPIFQGRGIGRALLMAADDCARAAGKGFIELETRVELLENHAFFAAMGFAETGRGAHPGFARPTSVTFRRQVPR